MNTDPGRIPAESDLATVDSIVRILNDLNLSLKFIGWVDPDTDQIFEGVGIHDERDYRLAQVIMTEGEEPTVGHAPAYERGYVFEKVLLPLRDLVQKAFEAPQEKSREEDEPNFRLLNHRLLRKYFANEEPVTDDEDSIFHNENVESEVAELHGHLEEDDDEHDHRVEEHGEM